MIKKANYEDVYFMESTERNNISPEILSMIANNTYTYDDDSKLKEMCYINDKEFEKYGYSGKQYIRKSLLDLYHHVRIHNKFDARVWYRGCHQYGNPEAKMIFKYITQVEDDECLKILLDFICIISPIPRVIEFDTYGNCLIINYFLKEYENYKDELRKISESFRKCVLNHDSNSIDNVLFPKASVILYTMFLENDEELVFIPIDRENNITPLRYKNNQSVFISNEEQQEILELSKRKMNIK